MWPLSRRLDGGCPPLRLNGPHTADGGVKDIQISPDSTRIGYTADQDTNDVTELYTAPIGGGSWEKINGPLVPGGVFGAWLSTAGPSGSAAIFSCHDNYVFPQLASSTLQGAANVIVGGISHLGMAFSSLVLDKLLEALEQP